jgi:hypothetical protein
MASDLPLQPLRRASSGLALLTCILALSAPRSLPGQATRLVQGRVLAERDSTPLNEVLIRVVGVRQSALSDAEGRFRLDQLPAGALRLAFERIGIRPDTIPVPPDETTVVVYLRSSAVVLPPVTSAGQVSARERFERIAQTSTVTLEPVEMKTIPGVAEPDVARTIQLLPGTVAKHDFSAGLNVRGGENDQNLIRLDGVPVFNPTHIGGLFGTFDPNALRSAEFITGGFPAGYGGRLSSVLDLSVKDGARDVGAQGAVSVLSAKLLLEGPVPGTSATYLIGGRRTYADQLADNFTDDPFTYYFLDGIAKVTLPLGRGASLSATGYWGHDDLVTPWIDPTPSAEGVDLAVDFGNRLAGATLRVPLGTLVLEQHASVSQFTSRQAFTPEVSSFQNTARVFSVQTALGATLGSRHQLRLGGGWEGYRMVYRTRNDAVDQDVAHLLYRPQVWSAFVDEQWKPVSAVLIRPGVRLEHVTGADVTSIAPRVAAKAFLTSDVALIGSVGRYYQAVQSISDQELAVNLFDVWIGADSRTPVARSEHLVGGFEAWLGDRVSLTIEGYLKSFEALAIQNVTDDPKIAGDEFEPANGDARGVDVLLRRHSGAVKGWVAYSLTTTERRTATDTFPPGHDRRHSLDLVIEAPAPLGSQLGLRWGYGSPLPYTGIAGAWLHRDYNPRFNGYDQFAEESVGGAINGERYPYYSRLDFSLRWRFEKWGGVWHPYFQVVNAYNRQNIFVYRFDYRSVPPTRSGLTQLPLLPTVGLEFEF